MPIIQTAGQYRTGQVKACEEHVLYYTISYEKKKYRQLLGTGH